MWQWEKIEVGKVTYNILTDAKTSGRDGHIPTIKYRIVATVLYL